MLHIRFFFDKFKSKINIIYFTNTCAQLVRSELRNPESVTETGPPNERIVKCKKKHISKLFPPGLEPGTFRVLGERDNHYTTETLKYCNK